MVSKKQAVDDYVEQVDKALAILEVSPPELIAIETDADLTEASAALRDIATKKRVLDEERKAITGPIDKAKSVVMAKFKPFIDALDTQETALRRAITSYQSAKAARQREEQARLRDEQAALQAAAEEKAMKLLKSGKQNQALATLANVPPVPTVVMDKASTPGVTARQTWKYRVTNKAAFVLWAFENDNDEYVMVNERLLGEVARSSKGKTTIPGIEFYPEDGLSVRRA